jgi:hypothetical protein
MSMGEEENDYGILKDNVARIKKFGIMGTKFRNNLERYDRVSKVSGRKDAN